MSGSISFVGTNNTKQVVHTFCNVARTDLLYHTLNPSEETVQRRLERVWARAWEETFSDVKAAKAFVSSELQGIHPTVFTHYAKSIEASDTLQKIKDLARTSFKQADRSASKLYKNLSSTHAAEVKVNLRTVWAEAQNRPQGVSLEAAKLAIEADLNTALVPQNIKKLYLEDLRLANTMEGLKNRLQSYLNDLEVKGEGIISTSLGSQGYPKIIDIQRGERILGFMKTLGNSLEMDYHLLYSFFLGDCLGQEELQIQVPRASMFDIERAQYVDSSGEKYGTSKYNDLIKTLLSSLAILNTKMIKSNVEDELKFQKIIQTCPTGFFELVNGLNLEDFFREKYLPLNDEQKDCFWFSLGLITYLDLILGNRDRLIKLLPDDEDKYSFSDSDNVVEQSNLGNLMISHDFTKFYPIDNGIGDGRRNLSADRKGNIDEEDAYTTFLKNLLEQKDFESLASKYLISSLKPAVESAFQAADVSDADILQSTLSDISEENHLSSIGKGMKHMGDLLAGTILPKWNHSDADPIRQKLDKDFVSRVQTRLDLFGALRHKPTAPQTTVDSVDDLGSELQFSSSDAWNSPVRSHSNETPFSPVMFGYKHVALEKIAEHLKELALEISSTDVRSRIDARLSSLQRDFLLPQSEQLKISEIQSLLSDPTSDKAVIASRIQELAGNLLSIPQTAISPRPNRLPSWGEANETDFSLSNLSLRQPSF